MTRLTFLPHPVICPDGKTVEVKPGISICNAALEAGIPIDHACEKACACTTCHVIVREGYDSLEPATEKEEDLLDKAWGLEPESRLSCQTLVAGRDLVIEIPRYTINLATEKR